MKSFRVVPAPMITFALALTIRIAYNLTAGRGYIALFDAAEYERLALHLLQEHCFCNTPYVSSVARAPLWPAMIAIIYAIAGPSNLSVRLFLSLLGSGTCVLVYCFARDVFGRRYGLLAGVVAACYPGLFVYDGWLYSESVYTFFFLAFAYTLYRFQRRPQWRWLIASAVTLALSALTRQNGLSALGMLAVFLFIVGWKRKMPWRAIVRAAITIPALVLLIILPWTVRNYTVSHYIIPVATGSSTVLAGAYNDTVFTDPFLGATGTWVPPDLARPRVIYSQKCCTTAGEDPNQQAYAIHWIETHPAEMPRLLALHFINIWLPITPDGALPISQFPHRLTSNIIKILLRIMPLCVFLLAAFGLIGTWRRKWDQLLIIYLSIALTILLCIVFYGSVRFRAPIEPMLVILAIGGLNWLVNVWQRRKRSTPVTHPVSGTTAKELVETY